MAFLRHIGPYPWLSATLQFLQCINNGDNAVLHSAIDISLVITTYTLQSLSSLTGELWGVWSQLCVLPESVQCCVQYPMLLACVMMAAHWHRSLILTSNARQITWNISPVCSAPMTWYHWQILDFNPRNVYLHHHKTMNCLCGQHARDFNQNNFDQQKYTHFSSATKSQYKNQLNSASYKIRSLWKNGTIWDHYVQMKSELEWQYLKYCSLLTYRIVWPKFRANRCFPSWHHPSYRFM